MFVCVSPVRCVSLTCVFLFRSVSLAETNALLCEQLSQSEKANQGLRVEVQKLTDDWTRAVAEMEQKESDWLREEEVCSLILNSV